MPSNIDSTLTPISSGVNRGKLSVDNLRVQLNTAKIEISAILDALEAKQNTLISGTNIKTINGVSIIGSGNIDIIGGGGSGGANLTTTRDASTVTVFSDTGTDAILAGATTSLAGVMINTDKAKLDGIASGATANSTDAQLRDRSTHTGTQTASTISDFSTATDARITLQKGANNGLAPLDSTGKVPSANLPSYVDDVLEFANLAGFPATGESSKIYIAIDTNKSYRWSGSVYVEISSSAVSSVAGKTGVVTLNSSDVGLGNVNNTSDLNKPISTATQTALDSKQNTLVSGTNIKTVNGQSLVGSGDIVTSANDFTPVTFTTSIDLSSNKVMTPTTVSSNIVFTTTGTPKVGAQVTVLLTMNGVNTVDDTAFKVIGNSDRLENKPGRAYFFTFSWDGTNYTVTHRRILTTGVNMDVLPSRVAVVIDGDSKTGEISGLPNANGIWGLQQYAYKYNLGVEIFADNGIGGSISTVNAGATPNLNLRNAVRLNNLRLLVNNAYTAGYDAVDLTLTIGTNDQNATANLFPSQTAANVIDYINEVKNLGVRLIYLVTPNTRFVSYFYHEIARRYSDVICLDITHHMYDINTGNPTGLVTAGSSGGTAYSQYGSTSHDGIHASPYGTAQLFKAFEFVDARKYYHRKPYPPLFTEYYSASGSAANNNAFGNLIIDGRALKATGWIQGADVTTATFSGNPANNDTITFNGTVVTFVSGTPTGNQVKIGSTVQATIYNLVQFVNSSTDVQISKFKIFGADPTLYIRATTPGASSGLSLAESSANISLQFGGMTNGSNSNITTTGTVVGLPPQAWRLSGDLKGLTITFSERSNSLLKSELNAEQGIPCVVMTVSGTPTADANVTFTTEGVIGSATPSPTPTIQLGALLGFNNLTGITRISQGIGNWTFAGGSPTSGWLWGSSSKNSNAYVLPPLNGLHRPYCERTLSGGFPTATGFNPFTTLNFVFAQGIPCSGEVELYLIDMRPAGLII